MELPTTTKDITVEWLNEVLHENGFLGIPNIVSLNREPIGEGKGFLSDMARFTVTYSGDSSNLPATMIAKLPTEYPSHRHVAMLYNVYEKEIRFYTEIAPQSPIRVPQVYYAAMRPEEEKFVLLMEDCACYEEADPDLEGLDYEQVKISVETIAAFHARWWDDTDLMSLDWMAEIHDPAYNDVGVYRGYWETCSKADNFKDYFPEGGWELGLKIYEKRPWLEATAPKNNLTFLHVDFKADNMFFDWGKPANPLIVFDWSLTFIGRGPYDLATMMGLSMSIESRRKYERELVSFYHENLLQNGVKRYTYNECWNDYLRGLIQLSRYPLGLFSRIDGNSSEREIRLTRQSMNQWFTALLDNDAVSMME